MPKLGDVRKLLFTLLAVVIVLRLIVWAVMPFFPYLVIGVALLTLSAWFWNRTTKL